MYMKKMICWILLILLLFLFPNEVYSNETAVPKVNAQAAILMDYESGRILWSKNEKEPKAMASTTKIMTCILALEKGNLLEEVTVSKRAALAPRVKMDLHTGEKQRLEDLLYALMLESANDAAVAIAEHIGGSVEDFCSMMTEKAKEIGATDTVFKTPNGLDLENHHSTAYDLALITQYALHNATFMEIINTRQIVTPKSGGKYKSYHLANKNRLLSELQGANGVKTGYTGKAGHCFVGTAKRGEMQLISVVLASGWGAVGKAQKWIDTKRILEYGFVHYSPFQILHEGQMVQSIPVEHAREKKLSLCYGNSLRLPLREQEREQIRIHFVLPESIEAPISKGQTIGTGKVFIKDELIREIPLVAVQSIERHDFSTSLQKIMKSWLMIYKHGIIVSERS